MYFQNISNFGWVYNIFISFFLEYSLKFGFEFQKPPSFRVKMPSNITWKNLIKTLYEQYLNYHLIKNRLYIYITYVFILSILLIVLISQKHNVHNDYNLKSWTCFTQIFMQVLNYNILFWNDVQYLIIFLCCKKGTLLWHFELLRHIGWQKV